MNTRLLRTLAAAAAVAVLAAACGSDDTDATESEGATGGTDGVGRIVALDDFAAVHILSLGLTPDVVFNAFEYETTTAILEAQESVDVQPYGPELDVESVIAAEPDVIIGVSLPTSVEAQPQLEEIADVTIFDYASTWDEQLADVAAALGKEDEAAALIDGLQADLDALAEDVAKTDYAGVTASVVSDNQGMFSVPEDTGLGGLLKAAGLARPASQITATPGSEPFVEMTAETLLDHDGDIGFVLFGGAYTSDGFQTNPLWQQLRFVQDDEVWETSGEIWLGTSAFSVDWVLDDLRAILVDGGAPATNADAASKFEEFVASA